MTIQTNTGTARRYQPSLFLMGLIVLMASWACMAPATQAQILVNASDDVQGIVLPLAGVDVEVILLEDLTSMDLSAMSSKEWKALRKEHTRLLGSPDERVRQRAMQNITFFAKTYPDVDFTRAVPGLYKIYQRDEHENHRIIALSALSAIGNRNVMDLLREDVSQEQSERVRRYTLYALADFYEHRSGQ